MLFAGLYCGTASVEEFDHSFEIYIDDNRSYHMGGIVGSFSNSAMDVSF